MNAPEPRSPAFGFVSVYKWPSETLSAEERGCMEFRLLYKGQLTADMGLSEKHEIRKQIHSQMARLWQVHPALRFIRKRGMPVLSNEKFKDEFLETGYALTLEQFADLYKISNFRFVPLVCDRLALSCGLDIVWLRRENPGALVDQHGDIDNRLKIFFDCLRMPKPGDEVSSLQPSGPEENPFFCLLEDDRLITDVRVTADHLLMGTTSSHPSTEVYLVVHVKIKLVRAMPLNLAFS